MRVGVLCAVQEFTDVWRGDVVEGLEGEKQNLHLIIIIIMIISSSLTFICG